MEEKKQKQKKLEELESQMYDSHFWDDKVRAQSILKEIQDLKSDIEGIGKYDRGNAIMTIFGGAGGDDAEDFSRMLLEMYSKFATRKGFDIYFLHQNQNDHGGYRNVTLEFKGKNAYGTLKNESGVHRLVRVSPFGSNKKRHTSFVMVEVIPKFEDSRTLEIPERELEITIAKSGGPGGQNVNKRETAVRIVHIPTKLSAHVDSERSQGQNKEKAMEILKAKIYKFQEESKKSKESEMYVSKTTSAEWGSQIRSYVLHPYKMVKDHRSGVETSNVEKVLEDGDLDEFVEAEKSM